MRRCWFESGSRRLKHFLFRTLGNLVLAAASSRVRFREQKGLVDCIHEKNMRATRCLGYLALQERRSLHAVASFQVFWMLASSLAYEGYHKTAQRPSPLLDMNSVASEILSSSHRHDRASRLETKSSVVIPGLRRGIRISRGDIIACRLR